jgi:hypothetical protein
MTVAKVHKSHIFTSQSCQLLQVQESPLTLNSPEHSSDMFRLKHSA